MVCAYNKVFFSIKKEGGSNTCYNMDEPSKYSTKKNKPSRKAQILFDSTEMKFLEWPDS